MPNESSRRWASVQPPMCGVINRFGVSASSRSDAELQRQILLAVFSDEPWRISYYDGNATPGANVHFDEALKIEEPPFVVPTLSSRTAICANDVPPSGSRTEATSLRL